MNRMGMGVGVGRVRRLWVVMGRVSQRRVMVPISSPLSSSGSLCTIGGGSLCVQAGFVGGGSVGLRDDDVGVLQERSGAEAVVVDGLGVGLQVAFHVFWVEGEVGAEHGGQRG